MTLGMGKTSRVAIESPTEAFGSLLVSELKPEVQRKWTYGINSRLDCIVQHDGGTVVESGGELVLSTSATTSSVARFESERNVIYRPGQAIERRLGARFSVNNEKSIATTRTVVVAIRCKTVVNAKTSRVRVFLDGFTFGNNSGSKTSTHEVWINPGLVGAPSWTDVHADSVMEYDTASTDVSDAPSGASRLFSTLVGSGSGGTRRVDGEQIIELGPGDVLAVTMNLSSGGSSADQVAGLTWIEGV